MQDGDISNEVAPRLLVVFEGLIGQLDGPVHQKKHDFYVKTHAWRRAARMWTLDGFVLKRMWDYVYRLRQSLDIVTYLDEREAEHVHERLDELSYPFGGFIPTTLDGMVHGILLNPSVHAVFDGDPKRWLTYGGKGRGLRDF